MEDRPKQGYTRLALTIAAIALVVISLVTGIEVGYLENRTTTTTTTTSYIPTGFSAVTEEVIIRSELINSVCIEEVTNTTSTAYLIPLSAGSVQSGGQSSTTTTTETLSAIGTTTIYDNISEVNDGSTCTYINPHYNTTETCTPCE